MNALHVLLAESIDYAGLFPPAGLDLASAAANYAEYRRGPAAWALGRLVVPAARLAELEDAVAPLGVTEPWRLSVLAGADLAADLERLGEFNCRHAAAGPVPVTGDAIELKAGSVEAIDRALDLMPSWLQAYVEVPIAGDPAPLVQAIGRRGARAKVRTGGVTADAFPRTADLLRFLSACTVPGVPFKATAGLHHPLRAEYRLTYAQDSPRGVMFGFLNLFLAAAFLRAGMSETDAARLLEERSPEALEIGPDGIGWRGHRLGLEALREARRSGIVAFGSCSFTEPLGDLRDLRLLPAA